MLYKILLTTKLTSDLTHCRNGQATRYPWALYQLSKRNCRYTVLKESGEGSFLMWLGEFLKIVEKEIYKKFTEMPEKHFQSPKMLSTRMSKR